MQRLAILGSTGSIGVQALEVVDRHPQSFQVVALTANTNHEKLREQAWKYRPLVVGLSDARAGAAIGPLPEGTKLILGRDVLKDVCEAAELDLILVAVVGIAGLPAVMTAIETGARIALANKEALVAGGALVMNRLRGQDRLFTVDSEHSAIWQCIKGLNGAHEVARIVLTASGGPFRTWSAERIKQATIKDALAHPTWNMGTKITIDSATMMNKGLEVIEAHWLFNMPAEKIDVLVHPQSIIHSMVVCVDGAVMAQLSVPDMRLPIQYALMGNRRKESGLSALNLATMGPLTFEEPDVQLFPCLRLAYQALEAGGMAPVVLNAANEAAVEACLAGCMKLSDVPYIIEESLSQFAFTQPDSMEAIMAADQQVRRWVAERL